MMRTFPIYIVILGVTVILSLVYFFSHDILTASSDYVRGVDSVEFTETIDMYDEEDSVYFDSTKESLFLNGIFGDTTINEVFITSRDGSTEYVPINDISFEIGEKWQVKKEGVQQIKRDGDIESREVHHYTIIGPEDEIVDLSAKFTTTFKKEFPISHDDR